MNKIVFECIKQDGDCFTLSMESNNRAELLATVPATVAAYRRQGIEVISASSIEELTTDLDLHATPIEKPARAVSWISRFTPTFGLRPMWIVEKIAVFGGLTLAVVGFDDGLSVANLVAHAEKLIPSLVRVL